MSWNYQANQIPPVATDGRRQHHSDPVQYNYEPQGQRDDLSLRMLMPYLDELAANGLTIAGNLAMSTEWDNICYTPGRPRDHLQQLLDRWLQGEERQDIPHTLTFFLHIVRQCRKGKLAQRMEREIRPTQCPPHQRSVPTYSHQQSQPHHYPQQGQAIQNQHQGQQYPMWNEAHGQLPSHNDRFRSVEIPPRVHQSRMAYSSHQQGQGYQAGYSTPPPSHGIIGRRTSEPPQIREMSTGQPQQYWTDHRHQSLTYPQHRSLTNPQQRWTDPQQRSLADPQQCWTDRQHRNSTDHQHQAPSLPHERTHVGRPPPPVESSSRRLWPSNPSREQTFEGSGNMFNEGSGQFIDVDQEILTEPVEEEDSGSQPSSVDLRYTSAVHDGHPRERPLSNLPSQPSRVSQQEYNPQPYAGYDSHPGPGSQSNLSAPSGDQMQTTAMQPGYSTVHGGVSRNPPVPNTTSQGQFVPQQQQRNSPQLADPAQLFRLLPSGLSGTDNEPLTKEQLTSIFLQTKRQLQQSSSEADFGQDEGQRCISSHDLVEFIRGVFRIEIKYGERIGRGSGFFVKVDKRNWIITACHNLLSAADGGLLREGKWTDIKFEDEGRVCKIKTLDQALQREALKVKLQENLLQAEFLLPDNEFVLRERQALNKVIPNVGHLVFDPEDDILAIPCVDPKTLELECGAKVTAFHLDTQVMKHYVPDVTHGLAIVHCPWDMPTPDGWRGTPPRDIVQYNHGTLCRIEGSAIRYDMVTYPGSSGSPVFFCGHDGIVLVGVHRKSHIDPLNQCSHLTAEFITNEMLA